MISRLPFTISKTESFFQKLNEWIGDVFYDILPEAGFELRDEQIYMAFQLEKAFKEKKVILRKQGLEQEKRSFIFYTPSRMLVTRIGRQLLLVQMKH